MELSGEQRKKLQNALINAFPAKNKLEQMLSFELNKKLNEISTGDNLAEIVFEVIKTAEAQNWIEDLIIAAYRQNPGNKLLKEFALKIEPQKEKSSQIQTGIIPELSNIPTTGFEASEVGANYTPLKEMLSKKDFRAADEETARIMLWVVRREKEAYLREEDIKKFPCRDLRTIDQLWVASSGGKFGFSVQKQIWIECGGKRGYYGTIVKFLERVEWKIGGKNKGYDDLCWDLRGVRGHLPYPAPWVGGYLLIDWEELVIHSNFRNTSMDIEITLPDIHLPPLPGQPPDTEEHIIYEFRIPEIYITLISRAATCKL